MANLNFGWCSSVLFVTSVYLYFIAVTFANGECTPPCSCLGTIVDCSKKGILQIPSGLPPWTTKLDLGSNKLQELRVERLTSLLSLQEINLDSNALEQLPDGFLQAFPKLSKLSLNDNNLTKLPQIPKESLLTEIKVSNNKVEEIPHGWLRNALHLQVLDLSNNHIQSLPRGVFPPESTLEDLQLSVNGLHSLENGTFANLTNLKTLKLAKNNLKKLQGKAFTGMRKLQSLDLSRNQLETIEGLTFDGLNNLISLKLKKNNISNLSDGAFFGLIKLRRLELDSNSLTVAKQGGFFGLENLRNLSLADNKLKEVEPSTWKYCTELQILDLSNNHLRSLSPGMFDKLENLKDLRLECNELTYIQPGTFGYLHSLENLNLDNNTVWRSIEDEQGGTFDGLGALKTLSIRRNNIQALTSRTFRGLGSALETLDLLYNHLTIFKEGVFDNLNSVTSFSMNSSMLLCDCEVAWLPIWLRNHKLENTIKMTCMFPEELRGRPVVELSNEQLQCHNKYHRPVIVSEPHSQIVLRGQNVTLTCTALSSTDNVVISWLKDQQILPSSIQLKSTLTEWNTSKVYQKTSQLLIQESGDSGSSVYQCVAYNEIGRTYSSLAQLTVHVFPYFTKSPQNLVVLAGEDASFQCAALGNPQPTISWRKDGGENFPSARDKRMQISLGEDRYTITGVKAVDQGVYTCTASSDIGNVIVNANLTVLEAPSVSQPLVDTVVMEGKTAVLRCMASGNPAPSIVWYKDGVPVEITEQHMVTATGLVIMQAKSHQSGLYSCSLQNNLGSNSFDVRLTVKGKNSSSGGGSTLYMWIIIVLCVCVVLTSIIWVTIIFCIRIKNKKGQDSPTLTCETATEKGRNGCIYNRPNGSPARSSLSEVVEEEDRSSGGGVSTQPLMGDRNSREYTHCSPTYVYQQPDAQHLYRGFLPSRHSRGARSQPDINQFAEQAYLQTRPASSTDVQEKHSVTLPRRKLPHTKQQKVIVVRPMIPSIPELHQYLPSECHCSREWHFDPPLTTALDISSSQQPTAPHRTCSLDPSSQSSARERPRLSSSEGPVDTSDDHPSVSTPLINNPSHHNCDTSTITFSHHPKYLTQRPHEGSTVRNSALVQQT